MRVLLLHEMSGVHTELRQGLRSLGVDARIATFGDGFKNYRSDINLGPAGSGPLASAGKLVRQILGARSYRGFDVIQTISPNPFFSPVARGLEHYVFGDKSRCWYVAAGSDAIYRRYVRTLKYHPPHDWFEDDHAVARLQRLLTGFSGIVPVCWEYRFAMQSVGLPVGDVQPFPIDLGRHVPRGLRKTGKLKFFHPLNRSDLRYDFKGTKLITEAFARLRDRYSDQAEFISAGGLDHVAYDQLTQEMDVIVDQTYSYSYGMSAAYGLAKGKVVLSGMESDARAHGFYRDCPVVNIQPRVDDIVEKIERLILDRPGLVALGERSRAFAEQHHDHVRVAQNYLQMYQGGA